MPLKVVVTSILVEDQEKALRFYTEKLGFVKKHDVPMGEARWLTLVSPLQPEGCEVLLEPLGIPEAKTWQAALRARGIPATSFGVDDVRREHERLSKLGVAFTLPPTDVGAVTIAVLDDTCGNLLQIAQPN